MTEAVAVWGSASTVSMLMAEVTFYLAVHGEGWDIHGTLAYHIFAGP